VIGGKLRGGEIIELVSDLGGGKTTFVRGLAKGVGSHDLVSSPSFTLTNEYRAGKLTIYHFDFYRLQEAGIMRNKLTELLEDPQAIIVVEWAELVADGLPDKRLTVKIKSTDETSRQFIFEYPENLKYLIKDNT
jgi:tRNA threonylcarbamoyladenosine biosynthesis protein TsaE